MASTAPTFQPDKPCKRNHLSPRLVSNGACVECSRILSALWKKENAERVREVTTAWRHAHPEGNRKRSRAWQLANPERVREGARRRRAKNLQKERERARKFAAKWRAAHPEESKARVREWHKANASKISERMRAWRKANPEKIAAHESQRRAREYGGRVGCRKKYLAFLRHARSLDSAPCNWCGTNTTPGLRHIDHVIPLARGGADAVENLVISCPDCNLRKHSKLPDEFLADVRRTA